MNGKIAKKWQKMANNIVQMTYFNENFNEILLENIISLFQIEFEHLQSFLIVLIEIFPLNWRKIAKKMTKNGSERCANELFQ